MDICNQRLLVAGCLLTGLIATGFPAIAKDKTKDKPSHELPTRATTHAPAAVGPAASTANRAAESTHKEAPRARVETAPRIERRNDQTPPVVSRPLPQVNSSHGPSKRDDAPRDNRGGNDRSPAKVIGGGYGADLRLRPDRGQVDSTPKSQPEVRVDRRDRIPTGNGNTQPRVIPGNPVVGQDLRGGGAGNPGRALPTGPALRGADGIRAHDRRDDKNSLPKLEIPRNETGRQSPNPGVDARTVNPREKPPSGPALGGTGANNFLDRHGDNRNRDSRDKNNLPKLEIPRHEPSQPNLHLGNDARTGAVRGDLKRSDSGTATIIGKDDSRHRIPVRIEKNGHVPKLETHPDIVHLKPEVSERMDQLRQTRDHKEFEQHLHELKALPDAKSHAHLAGLNLDRVSGVYQHRIEQHDFQHLHNSDVGRRLDLDRQFQLHRHGDLSRQMNLGPALVQAGGWQHRHHGHVVPTFTQSSFSVWYAGGGYYPRYCWTPRWTPWVDWCWWDTCLPIYDPRPVYCRPVVCNPCPTWVAYEYPVWRPLPVTTCGTWVDVPPVIVDSGTDLQLLATRFVDNGHPDQNLGPRYRVWLRNNGPLPATTPFNVMLIAANDPVPRADLPQAGAVVNGIAAGEIQSVDIRLPLAANRLAATPEGQRIPFGYLHVLIDSHRELAESDETNNGAVLARNDILPVDPAAFSSDVSAGAPGTVINVAGEGFGPEPGQVIVSINGLQLQAEIHGWYDLGVRFALPNIALAGATDADILIVRGDGAAANPLDFDLVPPTMLGDSPLPPIPSP